MLKDYTSLSPTEEATFNVYEQRMQADSKKAMNMGLIVGGIFGVIVVIIFFMGEKDMSGWENQQIKGDKSSMGKESKSDKAAAKPDPAPVEDKEEAAEGGDEKAAEGGEEKAAEGGEAADEKAEGGE